MVRRVTMRRIVLLGMTMALVVLVASPLGASNNTSLDGPDPAIWLSDPERDVGDNGIEQGDPVAGSSGTATVNNNGATIKVKATGLEPGHTYTMWVVYFSDSAQCADRGSGNAGCNGEDLSFAGGGVAFGNGLVVGGSGNATFTARMNTGDGVIGTPPPPFGFALYEAGDNNEFHVVIRSHGPKIAGEVGAQIHTFNGGCTTEVGPPPEGVGDFPTPEFPGECGDVQLYVFS
jgi:hypothetical protein